MVLITDPIRKRRAMTTEKARKVKLAGHAAEKEFADLIRGQIYPGTRKKDVIDTQGNIHSVKSGDKKWQIFLYVRNRFETSIGFLGAPYFIACIDCFPEKRSKYLKGKERYKIKLQKPMRDLKNFLATKEKKYFFHDNKLIFLQEAIFHSSEVDYLSIKDGHLWHIFDAKEVMETIDNSTVVANSKATQKGQMDDQKVIFKLIDKDVTIGEIEMRNDSKVHYRQVKFWMDRAKTLNLLRDRITPHKQKTEKIITHGKAIGKFKLK